MAFRAKRQHSITKKGLGCCHFTVEDNKIHALPMLLLLLRKVLHVYNFVNSRYCFLDTSQVFSSTCISHLIMFLYFPTFQKILEEHQDRHLPMSYKQLTVMSHMDQLK